VRLPTYAELRRFCAADDWHDRDASRGATTGDHFRYFRVLRDGTHLYTRVSHGSGSVRSAGMFAHILRVELQVTAEQFWAAVEKGVAPSRPGDREPAPERPALPHDLVKNLTTKLGLPLAEVLSMSKEQAVAAWQVWLTEHGAE
jgi:hypothetical protein